MSEITIGGSAKAVAKAPLVKVKLVGVEYNVKQSKAGVLFGMGKYRNQQDDPEANREAMEKFFEWIDYTFEKQAPEVYDRLQDPADALDVTHLQDLQQALIEFAGRPNPTTSSSGSPASRKTGGRTSKATR